MAKLGVNIDHVATVRQARGVAEPDPVTAAALAELAGADGITVHLREDRRHIQDRDVELLRRTVGTRLNLEMAATDEMVGIALKLLPDCVTLVPEKREELTTEGGLDVIRYRSSLKDPVELLRQGGITVSLFVDPDLEQIKAARRLGADYIEIHTGAYCEARDPGSRRIELEKIDNAVRAGRKLGLGVNAGHGLNYQNVREVVALGGIEEFNIGHSIVSRAVLVGMERAVREMAALVRGG
ncbi:pyridoxine 5'-phosphate synthase [Desulfuromonas sp. TF]|uniref:pyridoxine 5'-phosphate synthase n=1 Tax=Desulfuromonas sp. TF TaxID=1232410 RepID=UPI000419A6CA|nr:pyridoxine 5'-phosphate synthase [Desulfuromonas sp. TF]